MNLKKIGFTLIIGIGLLSGLKINTKEDKMVLRVAFPYDKEISFYEPTKIHLAPEYIFLENIYSPLIELNPKDGFPFGGVAESFDWKEDELHLYLRKDLKTVDGHAITAYDAEFSLKRLLVMATNTHGNFKSVICPNDELKSIEDHCDGIVALDEYHLLLKVKGKKQFLAKMIATIDFAIIPKRSVDPKTLKIVDYRNTSGPFYVDKSDDKGNITIKPNPYHYHYNESLPSEIQLVPAVLSKGQNSLDLFKEGKVDHITTIDDLKADKIIDYAKENDDSYVHASMDLRTFAVFFTEKGIRKFSPEERIAIGKELRAKLQEKFLQNSGYKKRHQLFMEVGDGGLSSEEMQDVERAYNDSTLQISKPLKISTVRVGDIADFEEALKDLSHVKIQSGKASDIFGGDVNSEDFPDAFIGGPDVSFMEDVGLISYTVNAGVMGIAKDKRADWLKKYMQTEDKKERVELLKEVHKNALLKGFVVPYATTPYVALFRKGIKSELPSIIGNNLLWKITLD